MTQSAILFDFNTASDISNWYVVDDGVMGGRSAGEIALSDEGHGVFKGTVSLENNGGFSSVRHRFASKDASSYNKFVIRLKGDGKKYQFRVKTRTGDYYSYIHVMKTSGKWESIEIPFDTMYPAFRGRTLELPNYPGETMEEIAFLIGNKKAETFRLEINLVEIR
ncbi:CIA30 family protein [Flavobacteriaceae bacterium TP-CH-4]|uniref:CIA30 family protein n=2 Tax=Pelagihabitans pacificus TaxID=2696054 RepID=A0A967AVT3_9FLAO|nr:CIA30 family protein [Pelagihabitans pacificus]